MSLNPEKQLDRVQPGSTQKCKVGKNANNDTDSHNSFILAEVPAVSLDIMYQSADGTIDQSLSRALKIKKRKKKKKKYLVV